MQGLIEDSRPGPAEGLSTIERSRARSAVCTGAPAGAHRDRQRPPLLPFRLWEVCVRPAREKKKKKGGAPGAGRHRAHPGTGSFARSRSVGALQRSPDPFFFCRASPPLPGLFLDNEGALSSFLMKMRNSTVVPLGHWTSMYMYLVPSHCTVLYYF